MFNFLSPIHSWSIDVSSKVAQLESLLSLTSTEPELAVRGDGRVLAPRLADATAAVPEPEVTSFEAWETGGKLQGKNKLHMK